VGVCAPHPYMPFGGIKESLVGNNKVQGKEGFDFFTQNKVSTIRVAAPAGQQAADAAADKPADIASNKGGVRRCIAS
jgi:malonate-semialdehyde dehydrogenase (acetylating)/methylmalonate-semialdehyde dehydrogenase